MRKTIVASNIQNNLEIIIDGYNGKIFEKDNYLDLENKIIELLDTGVYNAARKNAFTTYTNKFSYINFINEYKTIYSGDY